MKKWVKYIVICLVLAVFLVAGKQAFSYIYNEKLINEYDDENYDMSTKPLFFANCFETYIAYYNQGNICYREEKYGEAIDNYEEALKKKPDEDDECSIRINLALAMIYNMGEDYAEPDNIEQSIKTLEEARDVLLEKDCARDDGQGHSETAQKLKEEIDDLIEKLKEEKESQDNEDDENQDQNQNQNNAAGENGDPDQELMEQLQQSQAEAQQEREENLEMEETDTYNYNWNTDYEGIW